MGGSLESHQTTALVWPDGERDRLDREDHAWWYVSANPISVGGAWSCFKRLRLGSSHRDGSEESVHGPIEPSVSRSARQRVATRGGYLKGRVRVAMQLPKERSGLLCRKAQEVLGLQTAETIEQQLARA